MSNLLPRLRSEQYKLQEMIKKIDSGEERNEFRILARPALEAQLAQCNGIIDKLEQRWDHSNEYDGYYTA